MVRARRLRRGVFAMVLACWAAMPANGGAASRFATGASQPDTARAQLDFTIRIPPLLTMQAGSSATIGRPDGACLAAENRSSPGLRCYYFGPLQVHSNAGTLAVQTGETPMRPVLSAAMP